MAARDEYIMFTALRRMDCTAVPRHQAAQREALFTDLVTSVADRRGIAREGHPLTAWQTVLTGRHGLNLSENIVCRVTGFKDRRAHQLSQEHGSGGHEDRAVQRCPRGRCAHV